MTADTFYRGRRVMITGGLGFIGSNLAHRLVQLGADVLLVDSLIPDYGGNLFNIDGIADRVRVNVADIRQQSTMNYLVSQGVQANRITIISYGEERPTCSEKTEECWAKNRRAHFLVKPR